MEFGSTICLLVMAAIHVVTCRSITGRQLCPKLSRDEMRSHWDKLHMAGYEEIHSSFRQIPDLMNSLQLDNTYEEMGRPWTRTTHLYGPKKCSPKEFIDFESNCPTRYIMHHDRNRIPPNIVHAKCVCKKCRYSDENDYKTACQPVYTVSKVLRRSPSNCTFDWAFEKVPVACACEFIRREVVNDQIYME